jgi:hypothetical protein
MSTPATGSAPRLRATIRDVAALAGVGTKTVSRVINDEANVSPQTRERVQRAVLALNFKPNQGAGALRRGDRKTLTLGPDWVFRGRGFVRLLDRIAIDLAVRGYLAPRSYFSRRRQPSTFQAGRGILTACPSATPLGVGHCIIKKCISNASHAALRGQCPERKTLRTLLPVCERSKVR